MSKTIDKITENQVEYTAYAERIGIAAAFIINVGAGLSEHPEVQEAVLKVTDFTMKNFPKDLKMDSIETVITDLITGGIDKIPVADDFALLVKSAGILVAEAAVAAVRRLEVKYPDKFKDADTIYNIIYALFKAMHQALADTYEPAIEGENTARNGVVLDRTARFEFLLEQIA